MAHANGVEAIRSGASLARFINFLDNSTWSRRRGARDVMDFMLGAPQEMPLPDLTTALKYGSDPLTKDWYGWRANEETARKISARSLRQRTGIPYEPDDIAMTNGGTGGLVVALTVLASPGDEVIVNQPAWMFYEPLLQHAGVIPRTVQVEPVTFDLDVDAIEAAINCRTRAVIVNSPHNPTGNVYSRESLIRLAEVLDEASRRHDRRIYILSDEVFARIVFDEVRATSPAEVYDHTLVIYSWSKQLLAQGHRIGYLALHPRMEEREHMRQALFMARIASGFVFPAAVLQHALGDLDTVTIDVDHLQRKRDRMVEALTGIGYDLRRPDGTFYLFPRSPIPDDRCFAGLLAKRDVFVLPGELFDRPGYFRISLTATDNMIESSLSHFEAVFQQCFLAEKAAS